MIIAVTGHRSEDCAPEDKVRGLFRQTFESRRVDAVICGMANGADLWAGSEAVRLGIEVWAAKPWTGHGPRAGDEELYNLVLSSAVKVVNVTESDEYPGPWAYHKRNEWMVDNSTHVLAYLNPNKHSGGTFACVKYAKKVGKPVRNIYAPPF